MARFPFATTEAIPLSMKYTCSRRLLRESTSRLSVVRIRIRHRRYLTLRSFTGCVAFEHRTMAHVKALYGRERSGHINALRFAGGAMPNAGR
jgi:hypothetical protein